MSYRIYQTEAFILGSRPLGEANRYFYVLSRDLGFLGISAQGVRLLRSKLRYTMTDLSLSSLSVLRGKYSWRLASARPIGNAYHSLKDDSQALQLFARILALLRRMAPGEEPNEKIFLIVKETCQFLEKEKLSAEEASALECLIVLRLLRELGYLAGNPRLDPFMADVVIRRNDIAALVPLRKEAVMEINRSLLASQL